MEKYTKAQMEVIEFEAEDVITTSGCNGMDTFFRVMRCNSCFT